MKYDELYKKTQGGEYNSKLPYPPFRSVPKDHEVADKRVQSDQEMKRAWRDDEHRLKLLFEVDLRKYLEYELGRPITDDQFVSLFRQAWEDGHSSGYGEVLIYASNLADVVKPFLMGLSK